MDRRNWHLCKWTKDNYKDNNRDNYKDLSRPEEESNA